MATGTRNRIRSGQGRPRRSEGDLLRRGEQAVLPRGPISSRPSRPSQATVSLKPHLLVPRALLAYSSQHLNPLYTDGSDPGIRSLIETVYLDTFRDPLPELGPRVGSRRPQGARAISTSRPSPSPTAGGSSSPDPTLICHLNEHQGSITSILVSPDNAFFVTAGQEDGLVKVWDTSRLERNTTSKPRLVHKLGTRPTSMCMLEGTHCLAVAGEDGSVVVLRVHVQQGSSGSLKFKEMEVVRFWQCDGKGEVAVALSHIKSGACRPSLLSSSRPDQEDG